MPTLVDPPTLRTLVETDLTDPALQLLLDDADAEIIRRLGSLTVQQEVLRSVGDNFFHLARRASAITASVEHVYVGYGNPMDYVLTVPAVPPAAQIGNPDMKLHADGYRVERLVAGDHPSTVWRGIVTFTYTPLDETSSRKILEVNLVKLAIQYDGLMSSSIGDVRKQGHQSYADERNALFRSLGTSGRRIIT